MKQVHAGFTLIEMLVVLVMVAMVSGVLFQALERSYALQRRFGSELFKVQQGQMATDWYRQTVQGIYPDQPGATNTFRGDSAQFSGLTTTPLGADYGAPTSFQWKLVVHTDASSTELIYRDTGPETTVLHWSGTDARFEYLDSQWAAHNQWPPASGTSAQIPRQIQLIATSGTEPIAIIAAPMGPSDPTVSPHNLLGVSPP